MCGEHHTAQARLLCHGKSERFEKLLMANGMYNSFRLINHETCNQFDYFCNNLTALVKSSNELWKWTLKVVNDEYNDE